MPIHKHRVWDGPTRVFHWTLAVAIVALILSGNIGGNAMVWHMRAGYLVLSLLMFRVVWGFVGGHWSRFSQFRLSPAGVVRYLRGNQSTRDSDILGHSPTGSWSVVGLLAVVGAQATAGLFSDDDIATAGPLAAHAPSAIVDAAGAYHTGPGKLLIIALVALHLGAIVFYAFKRKRNLLPAMLHGDHVGASAIDAPASRDGLSVWALGAAVWVLCAALVAWGVARFGG
jgi:cytochrome b